MTRQHDARYTPTADPYAVHRCVNCRHIFYLDDSLGKPCRWDLCECVDHRPAGLVIEPGEASGVMSGQHFLIVHEEPDDGMDIEHPSSCPTDTIYDGRVKVWTCLVGDLEMQFGLGEYFHRAGTRGEGDAVAVAVGRHLVEYWSNGATDDRFDCGLRLVEVPDAPSS